VGCAHEDKSSVASHTETSRYRRRYNSAGDGWSEARVQTQDETNATTGSERMTPLAIITYVLAIVAAISAVAILIVKEVFHAALLLIVCLLCIAGIFVTFNAEFLAVVQLIVYAGGVLLLIIFGIMLTVRDRSASLSNTTQNHVISGVIALALLSMFVYALGGSASSAYPQSLSPEVIGINLVTRFMMEFELAGVLLLVSLIGAIVAATNLKRT
jgi:NADH-quinone oxidoreductase subunit J